MNKKGKREKKKRLKNSKTEHVEKLIYIYIYIYSSKQ